MENETSFVTVFAFQILLALICIGFTVAFAIVLIKMLRQITPLRAQEAEAEHQRAQDELAKSRQEQDALHQQRQALLQLMEKSDWKKPSEQHQTEIWNLFLTGKAAQSKTTSPSKSSK